jgi:hypothetical protein
MTRLIRERNFGAANESAGEEALFSGMNTEVVELRLAHERENHK